MKDLGPVWEAESRPATTTRPDPHHRLPNKSKRHGSMVRLDSSAPTFADDFARLLTVKREIAEDVDECRARHHRGVVAGGDAALVDYTRRFDRLGEDFTEGSLRVTDAEIAEAVAACPADHIAALTLAAERIEHSTGPPIRADRPITRETDALGVTAGWRWTALESVGLYVPGGTASYPSSVLMNAVPARVAGVPRIVMVAPAPEGRMNPLVLAAAHLSGVHEVYRVGGAQAVAALAYGTRTIAPVAKVVGPGNAWVAAAKRRVFGQVGIDMIAGPSEADPGRRPRQPGLDRRRPAGPGRARHGGAGHPDHRQRGAGRARRGGGRAGAHHPAPPGIARASWRDYGAIIRVRDFDEAVPLTDRLAPEHLEIETQDARSARREGAQRRRDLPRLAHAGSDRRLRGRPEPRAADRPLGPLLLRPRRARFHEAHHHPRLHAGELAGARPAAR